ETAALFRQGVIPGKLFSAGAVAEANLRVEPAAPGKPIVVTDAWGRSRNLAVQDGQARLPLDGALIFVNGAGKLEVTPAPALAAGVAIFEAEAGKFANGWNVSDKAGFSNNKVLEIWNGTDPGADGYWVEVKFSVPADGKYELIFSGTTMEALVAG